LEKSLSRGTHQSVSPLHGRGLPVSALPPPGLHASYSRQRAHSQGPTSRSGLTLCPEALPRARQPLSARRHCHLPVSYRHSCLVRHRPPSLTPPPSLVQPAGGHPEADGHLLKPLKPTSVTSGLWPGPSPLTPPRVPHRRGAPLRPGNRPPSTMSDFLRTSSPLCRAPLSAPPQTTSSIYHQVPPLCPQAHQWRRGTHQLPQRRSSPLPRPVAVKSPPSSRLNVEHCLSEPLSPCYPK
jgi:hypothetical protein